MEGTQNFNIAAKTLKECLKEQSQFGQTIYHNLCDGTQTVVPWGGVDWMWAYIGFAVLGVIGLVLLMFIVGGFFAAADY